MYMHNIYVYMHICTVYLYSYYVERNIIICHRYSKWQKREGQKGRLTRKDIGRIIQKEKDERKINSKGGRIKKFK